MEFEMIYDEEKLRVIMNQKNLGELSEIYHTIQEIHPLKLKILKNVTCRRCGWCCKSCNAMLSQQDIDLLCKYLQCNFEELYEKYMDKNARIPYLKLPCPFLNEDNDCDVYPARPKTCKEFPFNEFTAIIDPCMLGKDIMDIIEEIEGPITRTNEDLQKAADASNEFFHHMINKESTIDTGRHLRVNINVDILKKIIGHLKHKRKNDIRRRKK